MAKERHDGDGVDERVAELVPLPPAPLHLVLALNRGERHGYGLIGDVEDLSGGLIRMGPGTLYGTLKRLLAQGLIEESDGRVDEALDDQRRRYYRLTGLGRAVADAEIARLVLLVERSQARGAARLLGEAT